VEEAEDSVWDVTVVGEVEIELAMLSVLTVEV